MALDSEQLERYREQGFVVLRRLFAPASLAVYERRFVELALGERPAPEHLVVMRDVMVAKGAVSPETPLHGVNKILSFEADPVLFQYCVDPRLLSAARSLIGADLMTISANVFNKPPGVDGRHPFHQDLRYFSLRPADMIVAAWTAISPCRRENGCLAIVPGSHRAGLLRHGSPGWEYVNQGFFGAEGVDLDARVHVELEPGDTLLFHPLLLHGSGRNRTRGFRRAISTHYASQHCERQGAPRTREPVTREIPAS